MIQECPSWLLLSHCSNNGLAWGKRRIFFSFLFCLSRPQVCLQLQHWSSSMVSWVAQTPVNNISVEADKLFSKEPAPAVFLHYIAQNNIFELKRQESNSIHFISDVRKGCLHLPAGGSGDASRSCSLWCLIVELPLFLHKSSSASPREGKGAELGVCSWFWVHTPQPPPHWGPAAAAKREVREGGSYQNHSHLQKGGSLACYHR